MLEVHLHTQQRQSPKKYRVESTAETHVALKFILWPPAVHCMFDYQTFVMLIFAKFEPLSEERNPSCYKPEACK